MQGGQKTKKLISKTTCQQSIESKNQLKLRIREQEGDRVSNSSLDSSGYPKTYR